MTHTEHNCETCPWYAAPVVTTRSVDVDPPDTVNVYDPETGETKSSEDAS